MSCNVAIVGATGAVGAEFLIQLEQRRFPFTSLKLLASDRSAGKKLRCAGKEYTVEALRPDSFKGVNIALFSASTAIAKEYAPIARDAGAVVIDNSSAFRLESDVPLVVPEINPDAARRHKGIIANPNCTTIVALMAVGPLHKVSKITRLIISSYQAISGAGAEAMAELEQQTRDWVAGRPLKVETQPQQILFNLYPHIDVFTDNGYTKEEMKLTFEGRKILDHPTLKAAATCVRVPVMRCHSVSINVEFERKIAPDEARSILGKSSGRATGWMWPRSSPIPKRRAA